MPEFDAKFVARSQPISIYFVCARVGTLGLSVVGSGRWERENNKLFSILVALMCERAYVGSSTNSEPFLCAVLFKPGELQE